MSQLILLYVTPAHTVMTEVFKLSDMFKPDKSVNLTGNALAKRAFETFAVLEPWCLMEEPCVGSLRF